MQVVRWWHAATASASWFMPSQSRQAVHCVLKKMGGPRQMKVATSRAARG